MHKFVDKILLFYMANTLEKDKFLATAYDGLIFALETATHLSYNHIASTLIEVKE